MSLFLDIFAALLAWGAAAAWVLTRGDKLLPDHDHYRLRAWRAVLLRGGGLRAVLLPLPLSRQRLLDMFGFVLCQIGCRITNAGPLRSRS